MTIIPFKPEEHTKEINRWGAKHSFPLPPKEFLSDIGLLIDDTAVGFLYTTNSQLGWIEWVFANPDKQPEERTEALKLLMDTLEKIALARGLTTLFSSSGTDAYRRVLENHGFTRTDSNVTHHIKQIGV